MFKRHSHKDCQETAMRRANDKCRQNGVRLTSLRRQVLSIILKSHIALTAMDILEKSEKKHPPTIYRTLDFLVDQGIIHHIKSNNSYIGCIKCGDQERPILLICNQCSNVKEHPVNITDDILSNDIIEWIEDDFELKHKIIELLGICQLCRDREN